MAKWLRLGSYGASGKGALLIPASAAAREIGWAPFVRPSRVQSRIFTPLDRAVELLALRRGLSSSARSSASIWPCADLLLPM